MQWIQKNITLSTKPRGFHIISNEILSHLPELQSIQIGICYIHILHTSASLTINENADSTVREDFESHFNYTVPENAPYYKHTFEGADDMPAHIKASILGNSLNIPIKNGQFVLGTWQGIYLCEHRNGMRQRNIVVTLMGS
tara:strand:+ start:86 stop:508 length:423 start_codon:yes stop_codon:yes gene_type:complete